MLSNPYDYELIEIDRNTLATTSTLRNLWSISSDTDKKLK